jgi:hypothetical protein
MGLLDDAIREHLDLKRRRGADPTEIERAEREALGPVRREFDAPPSADAALAGTAGEDDSQTGSAPSLTDEHDSPQDELDAEPGSELENGSRGEPVPSAELEDAPETGSTPTAQGSPDATPNAESDESASQLPDEPDIGGDTVEFDVERSLHEGDEDETGDVLEETPEFLQDAPDHDRLWFEQRPPRDFDFEG